MVAEHLVLVTVDVSDRLVTTAVVFQILLLDSICLRHLTCSFQTLIAFLSLSDLVGKLRILVSKSDLSLQTVIFLSEVA